VPLFRTMTGTTVVTLLPITVDTPLPATGRTSTGAMAGTTAAAATGAAGNTVIGAGANTVAGIGPGPTQGRGGTGALAVTEGRTVVGTTTKAKTGAGVVVGTVPRIKGRAAAGTMARIVAEVVVATEMGVDHQGRARHHIKPGLVRNRVGQVIDRPSPGCPARPCALASLA